MVSSKNWPAATHNTAARITTPQPCMTAAIQAFVAQRGSLLRTFSPLANTKKHIAARLRMNTAAQTKWTRATGRSPNTCWMDEHPSGIGEMPHSDAPGDRPGRMVGKKATPSTAKPATKLSQKPRVLLWPDM
jgi:hypothetical protein